MIDSCQIFVSMMDLYTHIAIFSNCVLCKTLPGPSMHGVAKLQIVCLDGLNWLKGIYSTRHQKLHTSLV